MFEDVDLENFWECIWGENICYYEEEWKFEEAVDEEDDYNWEDTGDY